LILYKII